MEKGAGQYASISDEEFAKIGVKIVNKDEAAMSDVFLKVDYQLHFINFISDIFLGTMSRINWN